jgi:UMF1 family MFS transporter
VRFTKKEKSWIMYDWANSVYAVIIMAAVFPIYFTNIAKVNHIAGDVWWGYATSGTSLVVALSAPFLGSLGDFRGMKKKLFLVFLMVGIVCSAGLAFTDRPEAMLVGYSLSFIGFEGSLLFYDSFLTDVTVPERMNRVSSYGYAMGYLGGSTIPFVISILLIMFGNSIGIDGTAAVKLSIVMTALWWLVFSMPLLRHVRQVHAVDRPDRWLVRRALINLKQTTLSIIRNRRLRWFVIAYFFYIDGVGTVISMSTSYGSTIGLSSGLMILALLMIQVLAVPFSILFGRLADRFGVHLMLGIGIAVYMVICLCGFFLGFSLEPHQQAYQRHFVRVVDRAGSGLDEQTLRKVKNDGLAILSQSDRAEAFAARMKSLAASAKGSDRAALFRLEQTTGAFLKDPLRSADFDRALKRSTVLFWLVAFLVSTCQGGIQAISRSYYASLIPRERSNEFFGFYDIFGKFAAVIGPSLYAFGASVTGRSSFGILSLLLIFAVGLMALILDAKSEKRLPLALGG